MNGRKERSSDCIRSTTYYGISSAFPIGQLLLRYQDLYRTGITIALTIRSIDLFARLISVER